MKKLGLLVMLILMFACSNKETQERTRVIQDSIRIEKEIIDSINNLGVWDIQYYVDDFGEPTNEGYVSTEAFGTFSNSATTNSRLRVQFVIDTSSIRMNIYEYAGNHPIKGEGTLYFKIRDSLGETHEIETYNSESGNNSTMKKASKDTLRSILYRGGSVKFIGVSDRYGSPSEYKFTIEDSDHLEKALNKMSNK